MILLRWIAAFAALIAVGLIAVFALSRAAGIEAWWLLPLLVLLTLAFTLWRSRNQRA